MRIAAAFACVGVAALAGAATVKLDPSAAALAQAMDGHRVVLLGEVHDNASQHALRIAALRQLVATGARPAIAFEQFDRERQHDIDAARRARPGDPDYLIAQARGDPGWRWAFYRPYVELALENDLPIVAANLSRRDAIRVAVDGWSAVFDAATVRKLGLDALPVDYRRKHEAAIAAGHCNTLPEEALPARARAQMARDLVLARSLGPYVGRGVVLLGGNGHVRRDIGVAFWLPAETARQAIAIGLLESGDDGADFDAYVVTAPAERDDPCKALRPN
ncbi:MAG: ChaN family lipoprotein [Betaproteobacteria bacterium]